MELAPELEPCGVVVIDKPLGWTSRDLVNKVGRLYDTRSAGHAGTLDPQASGVLTIAMGEATKLVTRLMDAPKTYVAEITFGSETLSDDASGAVVRTAPLPVGLTADKLQVLLAGWLGELPQVPPQVSALQRGGVRDHKRVRMGEVVVREARPVQLYEAEVLSASPVAATLRLRVGSGFYVRALARDLGNAVQSAAHLNTLRRTHGCGFDVAEAVTVEALAAMSQEQRLGNLLPLLDVAARLLPVVQVDAAMALALRQGRRLPWQAEANTELLMAHGSTAVAMVRVDDGHLVVSRGFAHASLPRVTAVDGTVA